MNGRWVFVAVSCTLLAMWAWAGMGPADQRLDTDDPGMNSSCLPQMAFDSRGRIHVVWQDFRDPTWAVRYRGSADLGRTWPRDDARLSTWGHAENPRIAADGEGAVYVAWEAFEPAGENRICVNASSNHGCTWAPDETVLNSERVSAITPTVACAKGGHAYVAWVEYTGGSDALLFSATHDGGLTWSEPLRIDPGPAGNAWPGSPLLAADDSGNVYVIYTDYAAGGVAVYFQRSQDFGQTWQARTRLNPVQGGASFPALFARPDGRIHAIWTQNSRIFTNHSDDFGATWLPGEKRVDANPSVNVAGVSSIAADSHGRVYAVYFYRQGNDLGFDIYTNTSLDGGHTWTRERQVATGPLAFWAWAKPQVACDDSRGYACWSDARDGYFDIYFSETADLGLTWSAAQRVNTDLPAGGARSYESRIAAVQGRVAMVWDDRRAGEGAPDTYFNLFTTDAVDAANATDTDGDGLPDGDEADIYGTSPEQYDSDGDGLDDGSELSVHLTLPTSPDTDGDGLPDGWEIEHSLDPHVDSSGDDPDNDRLDNAGEYAIGTDPNNPDTDGDGFSDGEEATLGSDPLNPNSTLPAVTLAGIVALAALLAFLLVRRARRGVLLLAILMWAGTASALENEHVIVSFSQSGTNVEITGITAKSLGTPIATQPGSGGWEILLRQKGNFGNTHSLWMNGAGTSALTLDSFSETASTLAADWSGSAAFVGVPFTFEVKIRWTLAADDPYAEGTIQVRLTTPGDLPFYVSEVRFPIVNVTRIGANDTLLVPIIDGYLYDNPISNGLVGILLNQNVPLLSAYLFAYYDKTTGNCFYFSHNDGAGWWKVPNVVENAGANRLEFRMRHMPDDIFNNKDFTTPYAVRVGAIEGDWVDVARLYRRYLEEDVPWYQGPVGAASNDMPEAMKRLVAHAQLSTNYPGDDMDILSRDVMRMARFYGDGIYTRWYGAHAPDTFLTLYNEGYLPGRPSFAAALRESQKLPGNISAPYIQGSLAFDYTVSPLFSGTPSETNLGAYASAVINEDGTRAAPAFEHAAFMCVDAAWWKQMFPQNTVDVVAHSHARSAYCDYFGGFPCFSTEHDHAPGGGNYMTVQRMQHLRDIRAGVAALPDPPDPFGISMESCLGTYSEEVELMFIDPKANFFLPLAGYPVTSVPFFRYAHPNVKLSKITGTDGAFWNGDVGYNSWVASMEVFTFGQIIGIGSTVSAVFPSFLNRPAMPYYLYQKKICSLLRDRNFLKWHNGTMERIPEFSITNADGFTGFLGPNPNDPAECHVYIEQFLVPGMFRAPDDGSLAFVMTNPWVGSNTRDFEFTATFDPAQYPGFPSDYTVAKVDDAGVETSLGAHSGPFALTDTVPSGHIVYWVFRGAE